MTRRACVSLLGALLLLLGYGVALPRAYLPAAHAALAGDAVTLPATFRLVHSTGAEVTWSRYAGTSTFDSYQVHRSGTPGFTPSTATLLTTIRDRDVVSWQDTTAAAGTQFYYKVVSAGTASNEVAVTTPQDGQGRLTLQPDPQQGRMARIYANPVASSPCEGYQNDGAGQTSRLGVSADGVIRRVLLRFDLGDLPKGAAISAASMTTTYAATAAAARPIEVHRLTADWDEGTGSFDCNKPGTSWFERQRGVPWHTNGGDFDGTVDAGLPAKSRATAGTDTYDVKNLAQKWANGTPNFGMLLKLDSETPGTGDDYFDYNSDDATDPNQRPKLVVDFADGSRAGAPRVSVTSPAAGDTVRGSVPLSASAGDDRMVKQVDFLVDGTQVASVTSAPWTATWASAGTGAKVITARATDDVGNVTVSSGVTVTADNSSAPTVSLTAPTATTVTGTVSLAATASTGAAKVVFYADDVPIATDTTSPYAATWNTLDLLNTAFDGTHVLSARSFSATGQSSTVASRTVTVANTTGTSRKATFDLNASGAADDALAIPPQVGVNEYAATVDPTTGGGGKLSDAPTDGTATALASPLGLTDASGGSARPPGAVSAYAFRVDVTVTNASTLAWKGGDLRLWYRWYTSDGVVLFEGPGSDYFPQTVQPGASKKIPVTVEPPPRQPGVDMSQIRLRFDVYDTGSTATNKWFGGQGNAPVDNPVITNKYLEGLLGLERFWQYDTASVGAGMSSLVNVANGNLLLRYSPMYSPGRGLSTMLDLTYNSLEDHSESPVGNNFSLSMSGLTRFGNGLDIHPNNADTLGGKADKYVVFTDGDGTSHKFTGGVTGVDGITRFTEPAGVNLYLRSIPGNSADRRWAVTRPDRVTYYFDTDGFPTAVVDRNSNTLTFVLQTTPAGEDPGGPKKRITSVRDAGGRSFTISYYAKAEVKKARVRGKIKSIADHDGSVLAFEYYDDGNLRRLVQKGGSSPDGSILPDRIHVFTYMVNNGTGPAIANATDRVDPDPATNNQSTRIYSVRDPRSVNPPGPETTFAYYTATDPNGSLLRWRIKSRTERDGQVTSYGYDPYGLVTTVTAPLSRVTRYTVDSTGRVGTIVNPLNQSTSVYWTTDNKVSQVTEPSGAKSLYGYNANGYPTSQTNEATETTALTYYDTGVDAYDTGKHLSDLATVTRPKGTATTTTGDYQWSYTYDSAGNPDTVQDPTNAVTNYDYNLAGSTDPGTVARIYDANGNGPTTFPTYDPSGQPAKIVDPVGDTTQFGYDLDGRVKWIQDPNHLNDSGTDERSYKTWFDYDPFGRLARQSAPKSTATDRGNVLWSSAVYDLNDNVVRQVQPHYAKATGDDPNGAPVATATFDAMDRPLVVANPDTSVDPNGERTRYSYDAAGRLREQEQPKGVLSATADDYSTVYTYDGLDRVLRQTEYGTDTSAGQSRTSHLCYDVAGDLRSVTSPRAGLASVTCPGNGPATGSFTATYTYDAAHRQLTSTDPLGHKDQQTYDKNGNVDTKRQDIDPATGRTSLTTVTYDQRDLPIKSVEQVDGAARSATTVIEYDKNGNRSKLVSPRGYDTRPSTTYSSSDYYVTFLSYDGANRMTRQEMPHDARDNAERQYVHRAYDPNGNLAWTSLPVTTATASGVADTARTVNTYFDPGWIRTSDDPSNPKVSYDYRAEGWQLSRVPDQKSAPGSPDNTQKMGWEYYDDGQVKARTDVQDQRSEYGYDANNNLLTGTVRGTSESTETAVDLRTTWTGFDEQAKVSHRKQGVTPWTFADYQYDANGNVTQRRENGEEDDNGNQTKAPRTYTMSYDGADWLTGQLDLGTDGAATCKNDERIVNTFWASGWEKQRDIYRAGSGCSTDPTTWAKKQTTNWTQFDNGSLRTLTTKNGGGTVTESHDVGYVDNGIYQNGNKATDRYVLTRADGNTGATTCLAANPCDAKYSYDARDKLISHQLRAGRTDTYTLDESDKLLGDNTIRAGNVTTEVKNGATTTKKYTADQLSEVSTGGATGKFWYDDFGNTDCLTLAAGSQADCSPSDGAGPSANLISDYGYDYLQRLAKVSQYSAGARTDNTTYTTDALDRTSQEKEDHTGSGNDRSTTFTYQGLTNQTTEEKQTGGDNPRTRTFSYDSYGHRLTMTDTATGSTAEPDKYTFGRDAHASVSQLIDDSGKVKASYGYDAYGGTDAPSTDPQALTTGDTNNLAPVNPYRYSNRRMDSGTVSSGSTPSPVPNGSGGYDMGARRYGPDTARFLQQDKFYGAVANLGLALDPLTQNRYALAGGNPVSYMEMDGHLAILDAIGDAIKQTADKISDSIKDTADKAGDALKSASDQASKSTREWLNSDVGKQAQNVAKEGQKEVDGFYGAVEKIQNLNSVAGSWMRNKDLPRKFRQAGSWWLNHVAKDKAFQGAKKFTSSPAGKILKRGAAAVSFGLDVVENYAQGDKALPAVGKAGIKTGGVIVGAKAGALAGGALGSVIPGVGTAAGGIVGGFVGGILGGMAGDEIVKRNEGSIDKGLGTAQDWLGDHLGIG
ncbi:Ig-like domain-containing protein [Plantactinospora siamensis]|uniref:Ig-like domain-containing protein n=1 Tax=Plantactinospora siamensis TaxID=555372 RepID=A0ABV6NZX5_9ACTN